MNTEEVFQQSVANVIYSWDAVKFAQQEHTAEENTEDYIQFLIGEVIILLKDSISVSELSNALYEYFNEQLHIDLSTDEYSLQSTSFLLIQLFELAKCGNTEQMQKLAPNLASIPSQYNCVEEATAESNGDNEEIMEEAPELTEEQIQRQKDIDDGWTFVGKK